MTPTTNGISFANISHHRSELMGLAMIAIVLFHVNVPRLSPFYGLWRMGNMGVDVFLFLSGVGLWYALTGNTSLKRFFTRRYLRIYPTWLLVASLYYLPRFLQGAKGTKEMIDLAGDVLVNWDFWLHDELTFWYIPATMMLYLFAPAYVKMVSRHPVYRWLPVLMIVWCVAVQWVVPLHNAVGHIEIFWSRVPIFFIGINCGAMVKQGQSLSAQSVWLLVAAAVLSLGVDIYLEQTRHGLFPLFIGRMLYIPATFSLVLLLSNWLTAVPQAIKRALQLVGMVSLEMYLLHVHFVLVRVQSMQWGYWGTLLACFAISVPLAWLLNMGMEKLTKRFER